MTDRVWKEAQDYAVRHYPHMVGTTREKVAVLADLNGVTIGAAADILLKAGLLTREQLRKARLEHAQRTAELARPRQAAKEESATEMPWAKIEPLYTLGLSDAQIAAKLETDRGIVARRRREQGLPVNGVHNRPKGVDHAKATRLYENGLSDRKIAAAIGVSASSICRWRIACGLSANHVEGRRARNQPAPVKEAGA